MARKSVEDILEQGIHGVKEINPEERRKFLGTLRERVVIALTMQQVQVDVIQSEMIDIIKNNKNAKMYLNGLMNYIHLAKYIKEASKYNMSYTIVNNDEYKSKYGLVVAYDYAIDRENIHLSNKVEIIEKKEEKKSKGESFFKKLFKR